MKKIFLDLETTGLPEIKKFNVYYDYKDLDKYREARILSICLYMYDDSDNFVKKMYHIIKPIDFQIKNSEIHGIDQEMVNKEGIEFSKIITQLRSYFMVDNNIILVGHNISFDQNVLASELYRGGYHDLAQIVNSIPNFCTMINGKNITKITRESYSDYKYPRLSELYHYFFKEEIKGHHNAEYDVKNTIKCYYKIVEEWEQSKKGKK